MITTNKTPESFKQNDLVEQIVISELIDSASIHSDLFVDTLSETNDFSFDKSSFEESFNEVVKEITEEDLILLFDEMKEKAIKYFAKLQYSAKVKSIEFDTDSDYVQHQRPNHY